MASCVEKVVEFCFFWSGCQIADLPLWLCKPVCNYVCLVAFFGLARRLHIYMYSIAVSWVYAWPLVISYVVWCPVPSKISLCAELGVYVYRAVCLVKCTLSRHRRTVQTVICETDGEQLESGSGQWGSCAVSCFPPRLSGFRICYLTNELFEQFA